MSTSTYPWEHAKRGGRTTAQSKQPSFTPEELAGLLALQARVQRCPVDIELDLDERRLGFARWLVDHGKLSEEL